VRRRASVDGTIRRIAATGAEELDARMLRVQLIEEIRRIVGFDAYAWLLTDPVTEVGGSPLADVPWIAELPRQIRLKYLTPLNRWTGLSKPPVACLRAATDDHPEESLLWRELLVHYDVSDVASVVFRDRFGCWGFLELWRIGSQSHYGDDEARFLNAINDVVTTALRRCQAGTFASTAPTTERGGPVVLVLSPQLEVRAQTPHTEEYLRLLVPPDADRRPVPAGAYNVGAQLLAVEANVDHHPPRARVHFSAGLWLTLSAARIGEPRHGGDIAVTIERSTPGERLEVFSRASGLTRREAELVAHLVTGADTRELAERMFLSEHTVQDHLKAIFTKTGAPHRRALLARVSGS
jgi:DNA-binding CsgD family transcriptional regulator